MPAHQHSKRARVVDRTVVNLTAAGAPSRRDVLAAGVAVVASARVGQAADPPAASELDRIKAQVVASEVYEQDSVFYQAMQIGQLEAVNLGWQRKEEYLDRIKAVTPKQIQAVAKKYLVEEYLTIARLEPLPIKTGSSK